MGPKVSFQKVLVSEFLRNYVIIKKRYLVATEILR